MALPVNPMDYAEVIDRVSRYYNTSADTMWSMINQYNLAPADLYGILPEAHQAVYSSVTGAYTATSAAGTPMFQAFSAPVPAGDGGLVESVINSNFQSGTGASAFNTQYVATAEMTPDIHFSAGANQYIGGTVAGKALAVVGQVTQAIGAVACGAALGKTIDKGLYNLNPDFWDDIGFSTLNPDTWDTLTSDMPSTGIGSIPKRGLNALLMIKPDTKKTTPYMEKDAFDYISWVLAHSQLFNTGEMTATKELYDGYVPHYSQPLHISTGAVSDPMYLGDTYTYDYTFSNGYNVFFESSTSYRCMHISDTPFTVTRKETRLSDGRETYTTYNSSTGSGNYDGTIYTYYSYDVFSRAKASANPARNPYTYGQLFGTEYNLELYVDIYLGTIHEESTVPGVGNQPGATIPPLTENDTPEQVAQKVHGALPDLMNNRLEVPTLQPDGTIKDVIYVPVPLPNGAFESNPLVEPETNPQADPTVDPESEEDPLALLLHLLLHQSASEMPEPQIDPSTNQPTDTPPDDPNPPDVGGGATPPVIVPTGSASALWAVYNPTQAQLNSLGAWLWSNNFVDQLLKMFNDPMQAIIGLHKTFIPPVTGSAQDIKVGYLNSGVSSLTVPVQYSSVDCGTIDCAEYFGNVFDYAPYTRVYIYLPFIGFKELDVAQVMRGRIGVKYYGDAFTGACLAEVSVIRDNGAGGVLYTYSGDCAAKYPLSHGSYMGIVNAIAGIGIGIGTALAGAPSIGVAGALGMAQHARANVEHSGGFSGNSGAMGIKKPYLVIMRPQLAMADNYEHFTGQPSNSNVVLGSASGYIRVKECHVEDIATATDAEKQMIESALKTGVII